MAMSEDAQKHDWGYTLVGKHLPGLHKALKKEGREGGQGGRKGRKEEKKERERREGRKEGRKEERHEILVSTESSTSLNHDKIP
jgi:hypothetical protein